MRGRASSVAGQGLGAVALLAGLLAAGLLTRPIALAFPGLYGFHAVLAALPIAFALSLALCKGLRFPLCFLAVALFSLLLLPMSPIMGVSSLAPMIVATLVYVAIRRGSLDRRALGVGFTYGALFYPCTVASSLAMGGFGASWTGSTVLVTVILIVLGAALAFFGAVLSTAFFRRKQGD